MVENKYLVNNKISSQYFVIYPLLAMTEVKRFLYVFTVQSDVLYIDVTFTVLYRVMYCTLT